MWLEAGKPSINQNPEKVLVWLKPRAHSTSTNANTEKGGGLAEGGTGMAPTPTDR